MQPPLIGHPQRIEPFRIFLDVLAKQSGPVLISGPTGSGKKRIIQSLIENGPANQYPVFFINGLLFSEQYWEQARSVLESKGTLIIEGIQHLPVALQARIKTWLAGQGPLFSENTALPPGWRIIATTLRSEDMWEDLLFNFTFHLQLPSLNGVIEDLPYHIKYFLQDKSVRYIRYFFMLKSFFHIWIGNLRELEHYLLQAMTYFSSMGSETGVNGVKEVFGEKRLRFYQDTLKEEWWYYPYRFPKNFTDHLAQILNRSDFRTKIINENLVVPLLKEEPGFLVFDLTDQDFEKKANEVYHVFSTYLTSLSY